MRRRFLAFGLILVAVLFSGCWDVEEIEHRAIVVAMGLDTAAEGKVGVSFEIPIIAGLLPPTAGGHMVQGKLSYVITSEADSTFAAVPALQTKTLKDLFAGQIKAIVISAALARQGISPYIGMLERHPKIPPQALIILTDGQARDILAAEPVSENLPALAAVDFLRLSPSSDQAFGMRLWQFTHLIDHGPEDPEEAFLPIISFDQREKNYILSGLGVFHGDRMVGKLSGSEARMFGLFTTRTGSATIRVPLGDKTATYRRVRSSKKILIREINGHPVFLAKIQVHGFLVEMATHITPLTERRDKTIEQAASRAIEQEMTRMVGHLQKLNSDILGLGELLRAKRPDLWRRVHDWGKEFPNAEIRIKVNFDIRQMGTFR